LLPRQALLSFHQANEPLHEAVVSWCDRTVAKLVTSPICIAETLWLLGDPGDRRVRAAQHHLLQAVARGGILTPALEPTDFARIAELNGRYGAPGLTLAHTAQSSASSSKSPGKASPPLSVSAGSSGFQALLLEFCRRIPGPPELHRALLGEQQPARPLAVGKMGGQLAAQGCLATGAVVAGARQFDHQIGAQGRKATALLGGEELPAVFAHH
jgi:hypothetical protein